MAELIVAFRDTFAALLDGPWFLLRTARRNAAASASYAGVLVVRDACRGDKVIQGGAILHVSTADAAVSLFPSLNPSDKLASTLVR